MFKSKLACKFWHLKQWQGSRGKIIFSILKTMTPTCTWRPQLGPSLATFLTRQRLSGPQGQFSRAGRGRGSGVLTQDRWARMWKETHIKLPWQICTFVILWHCCAIFGQSTKKKIDTNWPFWDILWFMGRGQVDGPGIHVVTFESPWKLEGEAGPTV